MKKKRRLSLRRPAGLTIFASLLATAMVLVPGAFGSGAAAYTTYSGADKTEGGCLDSPNGINCNNYTGKDKVYVNGGRAPTGLDAVEWAREGVERGAGEILLTSMDRDGTEDGYELELNRRVAEAVDVPVIASGGAGTLDHLVEAIEQGGADAVLCASVDRQRVVAGEYVRDGERSLRVGDRAVSDLAAHEIAARHDRDVRADDRQLRLRVDDRAAERRPFGQLQRQRAVGVGTACHPRAEARFELLPVFLCVGDRERAVVRALADEEAVDDAAAVLGWIEQDARQREQHDDQRRRHLHRRQDRHRV